MKFLKMSVLHRAEAYIGMVALVAVIAALAEMLKVGHMVALHDALEHLWHWVAHFVSEVASAEIGATVLFRIFGEAE